MTEVESNQDNLRIRHEYLTFLREAKRQSEASIDAAEKAICRFEEYSSQRDFKKFHHRQAIGFKRHLANSKSVQSGRALSKSTINSTLNHLKAFFQWLAIQPGYKSRVQYSDADYFHLSEKDTRVATFRHERPVPSIDQIKFAISKMPTDTDWEKRDRALIAITILTGARDKAITTLRLRHLDLQNCCLNQDAREVDTKFGKSFLTYFFPVGEEIELIVSDWAKYLRECLLSSESDPLFPATRMGVGEDKLFRPVGLSNKPWRNAEPVRRIFKRAFAEAGLPYFNPHSFRKTLALLGENICSSPAEFKAWSQNLGHENVLTTFTSYGHIPAHMQSDIIRKLGVTDSDDNKSAIYVLEEAIRKLKQSPESA